MSALEDAAQALREAFARLDKVWDVTVSTYADQPDKWQKADPGAARLLLMYRWSGILDPPPFKEIDMGDDKPKKYVPSMGDMMSKRRSQIEDAKAHRKLNPGNVIHVAAMESDGLTCGLKFRDVRGSDTYLLQLWEALQAVFRHEAFKLGYLPAGPAAAGYSLGPKGLGGMWAEDVAKNSILFQEQAIEDTRICSRCVLMDEKAGKHPRPEGYEMVLDPEKIIYCPVCNYEPFQLRIQTDADNQENAKAWQDEF